MNVMSCAEVCIDVIGPAVLVCVMPLWWAQGSWAKVWILRTCFWTVMFTHFGGLQPVAAAGVLFIQQWRVCESWACWSWALDLRSWGRGVCASLSLFLHGIVFPFSVPNECETCISYPTTVVLTPLPCEGNNHSLSYYPHFEYQGLSKHLCMLLSQT
jgi:hypothetical protein